MHIKSKSFMFILLLLLILIGLIVRYVIFPPQDEISYLTAAASKGDIEQSVLADGRVEAFKLVNVGAQVSGQIKALHVELGDRVTKGQLIAEIDDLTQQNNLKESQANLDNLKAQRASKSAILRFNRIEFERQSKLLAQNVGARTDYDSAKATLDSTAADIEALDAQIVKAQIAVDTANVNLGYTKISSPIDGIVITTPVEEGQTVNAVQSAPTIVQVAQLDTVTIQAQISEADVTKVTAGMPVYFTILDNADKRFYGKLRKIEPAPSDYDSSSTSTNTAIFYNGLFDIANPDGIFRISMTTQVYIILAQSKDAVLIPATALKTGKNGKYYVQVMKDDGDVVDHNVTVGINDNVNVEITSGLDAGEQVVISSGNGKSSSASGRGMRIRM